MYFNCFNTFFPLREQLTTEELNRELCRTGCPPERTFCLEETEEGLFWQGKPVVPEIRYVYMPEPYVPVPEPEEPKDDGIFRRPKEKEGTKEVWVSYPRLYRSEATGWRWASASVGRYVPLSAERYVETLLLEEDCAVLERYVVTADPCAENTPMEFEFRKTPDGAVIITDVTRYCERLTIPAAINGKTVVCADISYSSKIRHLRELVVEPGVKRLNFFWGLPRLARIGLPDSTVLVDQPELIVHSQWFRDQPEGPVYLGGWYCGFRGEPPEEKTLQIREGTVGVVANCDSTAQWKRIVLPESLTFIGRHAFSTPRLSLEVDCPQPELKSLFNRFYGRRELEWKSGAFLLENGKQLYNLCMHCEALKPYLRGGALPLPPRLQYTDRWTAEFLLMREDYFLWKPVEFAAVFDLDRGILENPPEDTMWMPYRRGFWTREYQPPYYLRSQEYLEYCVRLIRSGKAPEKEELALLDYWWRQIVPEQICGLYPKED